MRFEFHKEALEEYREAAQWYDRRELQLALRFVDEVEGAIRRVLDGPTTWRVIEEDVLAVLHTSFRTRYFIQSSLSSFSSWLSCSAVVSLVIGKSD